MSLENSDALSDEDSQASSQDSTLVPQQRIVINNKHALQQALKRIAARDDDVKFSLYQSLDLATPTMVADVNDDLQRELAFYEQALTATTLCRKKLKADSIPFARPDDYFAEMVKDNEHMFKIKQKIVEEATAKKLLTERRKQRELKKFGKQVQVEKLQERNRARKEGLDKVKMITRKRGNGSRTDPKEVDAILDSAFKSSSDRRPPTKEGGKSKRISREGRDNKFGFGGSKRHSKSNTATSTGNAVGFSSKRMKSSIGNRKRPGKSKRLMQG